MKNLLVYISPNKQLKPEHKLMLEVQIENSLDYWKKEDIILAFNFPYEYQGIKALEVPDLINSQYPQNPRAIINSKIDTIIYLLENKIINELTWFHDFDSFQLAQFEVKLEKDLGLVRYGFYPKRNLSPLLGVDDLKRINCGNIFFKPESLDIFKKVLEKMDREGLFEEDVFSLMQDELESRIQIMNQTYNIGPRSIRRNYEVSEKPIRVAHFPPHRHQWFRKIKILLPPKLIKLMEEKFNYPIILITGSTGFIGSHLSAYLKVKGHRVVEMVEDIRDKEKMRPYFKEAKYVIHLAARTKDKGLNDYYEINVGGTKNVIELCREYNCKLIHFGTIATTGDYGKSKQEGQRLVEEATKSGLQAIVLKLCEISVEPRKNCYLLENLMKDIGNIIK